MLWRENSRASHASEFSFISLNVIYKPLIPVYQSFIRQTNTIEMNAVAVGIAPSHKQTGYSIHDNSKPVINTLEKKRAPKMEAYSTLHWATTSATYRRSFLAHHNIRHIIYGASKKNKKNK